MTVRCLWITPAEFLIALSPFLDLIQASQETTVNVPQMADTLMERAGNASWVVVFKALITTHHLMVHGNEVRRREKERRSVWSVAVSREQQESCGCQTHSAPSRASRGVWETGRWKTEHCRTRA